MVRGVDDALPPPWAIASIWLGLGLFDALQTIFVMRSEGMHHNWPALFGVSLAAWLPWALATPFIIRLGRRVPALRLRSVKTWLVHIAACAALGTVFATWQTCLDVVFNPYAEAAGAGSFLALWSDKLANGMLASAVLYAGIVALSYAFDSHVHLARERTACAELNERLSRAQLDALQRQIEPHFLFNSLNAVAALVREGRTEAAVGTIVHLSDFLRRTLARCARAEVPLHEEVTFAQDYLAVQQVRFADRLQLSVDVPRELAQTAVPYLILQPLVENAVKHGIAKRVEGGAIRISAARDGRTLVLQVYNDGPGLAIPPPAHVGGIGIANVRSRLRGMYGNEFDVCLRDGCDGGVEAAVRLPLRDQSA